MESIVRLNIDDSQIKGAITNIENLRNSINETPKDVNNLNKSLSEGANKSTKSISTIQQAMESLKDSIKGAFSHTGNLIARLGTLKNVVIGVVGASLFASLGTTKENTQGQTLGIGWAGQKAKQATDDFMGISPDFASAREALSSYETKGALASLGVSQAEASELYNKGADVAYFELASKYEKKLRDYIQEAGGDKALGIQNFRAVYGEGLQQTLGTDAGDFASLALTGQLDKYKSTYFQKKQEFGGIDTKALMEGEKHLNNFLTRLKALGMTLSAELLPAINKLMGPLSNFIKETLQWAKQSKELKELGEVLSSSIELIVQLIKGVFETIQNSDFGSFILDNIKAIGSTIKEGAKVAKEEDSIIAGATAMTKIGWEKMQEVNLKQMERTKEANIQYQEDKDIRTSIRKEFGFMSKEFLNSSLKEGKELREYAQNLNVNIVLRDEKGKQLGSVNLQDVVNKGRQPVATNMGASL